MAVSMPSPPRMNTFQSFWVSGKGVCGDRPGRSSLSRTQHGPGAPIHPRPPQPLLWVDL